jgi:hypothetical protein
MPGTRVHGADNDLPRMPKPAASAHTAWRCQPISRASIGLCGFANPEFQREEKYRYQFREGKKLWCQIPQVDIAELSHFLTNIGVRSREWTSLNFLIF